MSKPTRERKPEAQQRQAVALRRALQASEARFHAIVDRSADGVVVVGTDGAILFVNPGAVALLGRPAEQLVGEVFGVPIVPGEVTEIDLLQQKGRPRSAEMRVTATEWQNKPAYLATLRDVTERKRREEKTKQAVRRRDLFLAALSHELRNPLGAIVSASHVLRRAPDSGAAGDRAREVIDTQSRLMKRLLDDLLDVARISCGKIELRPEPLDMRDVLHTAAGTVRSGARKKGLRLQVNIDEDEELPVKADPTRLQQIIVNLLTNAVRYNKPGGYVRLSAHRDGKRAVVRVLDNGAGIPAEKLATVFEPFQQGEMGLDRTESGLGIGLALVRSLVALHGGSVEAHSDGPDRGAEFVVRLPLSKTVPAEPEEDEADQSVVPEHRILIVEDNDNAREMLKSLLELEGHTVQAAGDARAALELLDMHPPQVALIDIGLPEVDGFELVRRIRSDRRYDDVYLVALTGYGQLEDRREARQAGFDAHLVKPLDFEAFNRLLTESRKRRSRRSTHSQRAAADRQARSA
jgi:two-component system CheB/CheR fusion protein